MAQRAIKKESPLQALGKRLKTTRESKGLSVSQAAKLVKVQSADWQSWEDGTGHPTLTQGVKAAQALGVDPRWLANGKLRTKKN